MLRKEGSYLGTVVATRALQMASQLVGAIREHGSICKPVFVQSGTKLSSRARKIQAALRDHLSHDAGIAVDRATMLLLDDL